jgi:hypothetical protein
MPSFRRQTVGRSPKISNSLTLTFKTLAKAEEESQLEAVSDFTVETVNFVANTVILFWSTIYMNVTAAQVSNTLKITFQVYMKMNANSKT